MVVADFSVIDVVSIRNRIFEFFGVALGDGLVLDILRRLIKYIAKCFKHSMHEKLWTTWSSQFYFHVRFIRLISLLLNYQIKIIKYNKYKSEL